MRFKEQLLWDAMRLGLSSTTRLERMENMAGVGTPDVLALSEGQVTFCELKATAELPKRKATRVLGLAGLTAEQRNWHMTWNQRGGRAIILIGIGQGQQRQHIAVAGRNADHVNDYCLDDLLRYACCAGVGAAFWPKLGLLLKGPM